MSKTSDITKAYTDGLQHALEVVAREGVEGLTRELQYRRSNPLPLNVSPTELTAVARQRAHDELAIVSTALAVTVMYDMHLPATSARKFLEIFNGHVDEYRYDPEAQRKASKRLDGETMYNRMIENYLREDNKNE